VTTEEIVNRLVASLIPFNKRFFNFYKEKPDLYGPFWIYTTLIIMIAISGNLSRYFQLKPKFSYNYEFVPIAATVIYSIAIGLPLALKFMMRFMGSQFFNGTFIEVSERIVTLLWFAYRFWEYTGTPLHHFC
jgi:protein YIPF1/2